MVEDKLKQIADLSYKYHNSQDKSKLDDELKKILDSLKKSAISKFESESDIKKFLDNIIKFNNYSYNNQMLIWVQRPDADYVASFRTIKKLGYHLNKDSKGIKVFIPNFMTYVKIKKGENVYDIKPLFTLTPDERKKYKDKLDEDITFHQQRLIGFSMGNVFSLKDTNMPVDIIEKELNPSFDDKNVDDLIDSFIKTIYKDNFKVEFTEMHNTTAKGYCDYQNKKIIVRKGMSSLMQMKVLIHEYAHALAHKHLESNHIEYEKNRNKYETEAESIAYVVSKYLNFDTSDYTLNYLYAWSKEKDFSEIDDSLDAIVKYSKRIIDNFSIFYEKELQNEAPTI